MGLSSSSEQIDRSDWNRGEFIGANHHIFFESLREAAHCEYPLYRFRRVAGELAQLHAVVVSRHMQHRDWTLDRPPYAEQQMKDYSRAALRNFDNDYRRSLRQWADP